MPINSVDTTEVIWDCPYDAIENTTALATLEAGARMSKNIIALPACTGCGFLTFLNRTFANPSKEAGAINGLHRHLVDTLAQTHADWTTELNAETDDDKPILYYVPTGTPATYARGTNGFFPYDTAQVGTLLGPTEARLRIVLGLIYTDDGDAAIAAMMAELFAEPSERAAHTAAVKTLRFDEFGV